MGEVEFMLIWSGGGYALLNSYRTTLTGLNKNEIRALFMLTIPGPIQKVGE